MTKIIQSTEKYLTPYIVHQCFKPGELLTIDKQVCGNGFSTSFLNLDILPGKVNIIIAPNKAVLIEKANAYKTRRADFKNRIKFFYKESLDDDFNEADVLFFVADSFLSRKESILNIAYKVEKVLIDENHSTEIQSLFRSKLVDFDTKIKSILTDSDTAITKITASPNLYNKADIFINNQDIKEQTIITSKDRADTIKRIRADIKNKENVVVFTNSSTLIYHLRNYKNEVRANFIVGSSLMRTLSELIKVVIEPGSNLSIVSSRGFEGFDIYQENAKVYYFEDRATEYESFYISNLYQAISRTRKGAKYIEYCRQEVSSKRKQPFKNIDQDINKFILDKSISIENKHKMEYKKYHPFVVFSQDSNGVFTIKKNDVAINLHKEAVIFDKPFPAPEFEDFIKQRKLIFKDILEVNNRLTKKIRTSQKVKNLNSNKDLIEKLNLFDDDYRLMIIDFHSHRIADGNEYRKLYLNHLETYLRRKNYNGAYVYSEREQRALNILRSKNDFKKLVKDITYTYDTRSIDKYGFTDSESYRKEFKIKGSNIVGMLIMMFSNNRINAPKKWVANRNYNLLTSIGIDELKFMGNVFNTDVLEIDARNCFPRILYNLCGKKLPGNFYGDNKENKYKINKYLNNFFYREDSRTEKRKQRFNAVRKFKEFGFDNDVINYLLNNFFECKHRGDLFAKLSFLESKIISQVKDVANLNNDGIIRRHDSVILFNNKADLYFLNDFQYLGFKGWFDVKYIPIMNLEPIGDPADSPTMDIKQIDDSWIDGEFEDDVQKIAG